MISLKLLEQSFPRATLQYMNNKKPTVRKGVILLGEFFADLTQESSIQWEHAGILHHIDGLSMYMSGT